MTERKAVFSISVLDNFSGKLRDFNKKLSDLNRPVRRLQQSLKGLGKATGLDGVGESMSKAGEGVTTTLRNLALLGAAGAGLFRLATSAVEAADDIGDLAEQTGASARALQVFGGMATLSGGSLEETAKAIGKLNRSMFEARAGSEKAQEAFRAAGISMHDLRTLSPEQVMEKMAAQFERMPNQGKKLVIANALMGKSSSALVAVLNQGEKAIRDYAHQLEEDGQLLSPEQLEVADRFDQRMSRVKGTLSGLRNLLGLELAEALMPFLEQFRTFLQMNREKIRSGFQTFLQHLPTLIPAVVTGLEVLWKVVTTVAKVIEWAGHTFGATNTAFIVLGLACAPLISALLSIAGVAINVASALGGGLFKAFTSVFRWVASSPRVLMFLMRSLLAVRSAVMFLGSALKGVFRLLLANPIVLVIAAIAGAVYLIYKNWDGIVSYLSDMWGRIKAVFEVGFFSGLFQIWLEAWQGFGNLVLGVVRELTPDWLMPDKLRNFRFTFAEERAAQVTGGATTVKPPTAAEAARASSTRNQQQVDVGGTLRIEMNRSGVPSISSMRPNNDGVQYDVLYRGMAVAG